MNQYIISEEQLQRGHEYMSKTGRKKYEREIRSHPYQSERDKVLNLLIKRMKEANNDDPSEWTWQQIIYQIEQVRVELRQQAGEP
jgi:hypothetical protein